MGLAEASGGGSAGQCGDLRQVVGQDPVSGPGPGAFGAVQAGPVPPVPAFEGADPAFAAGPPLDGTAERWPALGGLAGLAGFALAGMTTWRTPRPFRWSSIACS